MYPKGKPIQARPESRFPRLVPVPEQELDDPTVWTVLRLIRNAAVRLFHDPIGMILGSSFLLIMLWGPHGDLQILGLLWDGWEGPGTDPAVRARIIQNIPWDQEWISFLAGVILLVVVPCILIKVVFKQDLKDYGLGAPPRDRRKFTLVSSLLLLVVSAPAFYLGTRDPGMQATYPLFRDFTGTSQFFLYAFGYLSFFLVIEFIFRGYLLFGLFQLRDSDALSGVTGTPGPLVFGYYAILVSMLSYTAWHLGKPLPELWGTLVWGIAAGAVVLASRTIWGVVIVHWVLNVFMDYVIWTGQ